MAAGTIAQWAKHLLYQQKNLGSIPRTHIKRKLCVVRLDPKPGAEETERWVPQAPWPASLSHLVSFRPVRHVVSINVVHNVSEEQFRGLSHMWMDM